MAEVKKLSKHDVRMCYLNWTMFSHSCYNYERLQATSFAEAMGVILKTLYPHKEDLGRELGTHFVFFNTEPKTGGVLHGGHLLRQVVAQGVAAQGDNDTFAHSWCIPSSQMIVVEPVR